jgi:hypothetical protein
VPRYAGIEVNVRTVNAALRALPDVMTKHARGSLQTSGQEFVGLMQKRFGDAPGQLRVRSRRLRDSFGYQVTGESFDGLTLRAFSAGVPYANLQEFGGTVRPKSPRQFLTIPLPDNLTGAGVPRYPSAGELRDREPGRTFVVRSQNGKLLVGYRPDAPTRSIFNLRAHRDPDAPRAPKAKSKVLWLWLLVPQVTVPARLQFRSTWESLARSRKDRLVRSLAAGIREVGLG